MTNVCGPSYLSRCIGWRALHGASGVAPWEHTAEHMPLLPRAVDDLVRAPAQEHRNDRDREVAELPLVQGPRHLERSAEIRDLDAARDRTRGHRFEARAGVPGACRRGRPRRRDPRVRVAARIGHTPACQPAKLGPLAALASANSATAHSPRWCVLPILQPHRTNASRMRSTRCARASDFPRAAERLARSSRLSRPRRSRARAPRRLNAR
jgi:hypothetical protein